MFDRKNLVLYAVTDRTWLNGRRLYDDVKKAVESGVTMVQLREKNADINSFIKAAEELLPLCKSFGVPLIINDSIEVCLKSGADGVHLGQGDTPVSEARKILGSDKIIGITAKTVEQAKAAENGGADYIGSGAVFGTSTKQNAVKMELDTLKEICSSVNIPVAAIGGINGENILNLKNTGISGAAVVSGIFAAADIENAVRDLRAKAEEIIKEKEI